jgi:NAD(P)-dependent dehydrogenase (short-subunit alcohol dehydrogenase family)
MELRGAVVVVTGASSGFGEAAARRFAKAGSTVVLAARRVERLDAIAGEIARRGGEAVPVGCDVTSVDSVHALRDTVAERFGRCDALINNAGIPGGGRFEELSEEQVQRVILVNVLGVMMCAKAFLPLMLDACRGHIVNVASLAGRFATPGASVYGASKHAVVAFSEALYHELGQSGILVTSVNPAFAPTGAFSGRGPRPLRVTTDRVASALVETVRSGAAPHVSIPRWAPAFEVFRVLTPPLYRWGVRTAVNRLLPSPASGEARGSDRPR